MCPDDTSRASCPRPIVYRPLPGGTFRLPDVQRLARCRAQQADLSQSLVELLADLAAGRKELKVYRQMKMYNDATLNPYLYKSGGKQVA